MVRTRKKRSKTEDDLKFGRWAIPLLLLLSFLYFYDILAPSKMILATDQITASFMFREFLKYSLKELHMFPYWDPYIFSGLPFVGALHGDIFYPTSLLRLILPTHVVMNWVFILHVFLAGVLMYLFMREMKLRNYASLLFAISYMFTASIVSLTYSGHDSKIIVASFLPGIFLLVRKGFRTGKLFYYLLGSLLLGFAILSPHLQMAYYAYMAVSFYFLYLLIESYIENKKITPLVRPTLFFILMLILGIGIGLAQMLPSYYYTSKFSPRAGEGRGYAFAISWSLPWEDLLSTIFAKFSGYMDSYWGRNPFKINSEYLGFFVVTFSLLSFTLKKKRREFFFFLSLFLFFTVMALGGFTPIYRIFYEILPGLKKMRAPAMSFIVAAFSLNVMAGIGFRMLEEKGELSGAKKLALWVSIIVFILGIMAFPLKGFFTSLFSELFVRNSEKLKALRIYYNEIPLSFLRFAIGSGAISLLFIYMRERKLKVFTFTLLSGLLLIVDLWTVDRTFVKTLPPPSQYFAQDEAVRFFKTKREPFRVFPLFYKVDDNYLMYHRIESLGGHHGLQLKRYQEFIGAPHTIMFRPFSVENLIKYPQFLDVLNAKYVVTQPIPEKYLKGSLREFGDFLSLPRFKEVLRTKNVLILENTLCLPRVFFLNKYRVIGKDRVLNELKRTDLHSVAILEEDPKVTLDSTAKGEVISFMENPNNVKVKVRTDGKLLLVYSGNNYPEWNAYIDGRKVKIYTVDYILRGVILDKGEHEVLIKFEPALERKGFIIFLLSLSLTVAGTLISLLWEKK